MKQLHSLLIIISCTLIFFSLGCATSGGGFTPESNSSNSSVEVTDPTLDLADYLTRVPGVVVSGNGSGASVTIRGTNSFTMGPGSRSGTNSTPLFVIDGRIIGHDFARAYQQVSMSNVASIDVLKGADAARYGSRGANGVIEINYR